MISTLEINLALRSAFKNQYQKRETKAKTSFKGETVKSQVSIVTGKTTTKKRLNQETKGPNAEHLPRRPVIDTVGARKFWQRFATQPQPSGWDCNHINYLIHTYHVLLFDAIIISGEYSNL
ncbi:hypothetical protein ARMSODRAFT_1020060 [Armillaria solidipes]|uniref:Uncharacterized protein n=1 Tax=Armillaria solidipes TaxID=1076256 RepID=A0A2H3BAW1_9AGAR|nr:hypothetical protein ARMSODRAFT_1020060 [Armillaria solidipes]